MLNDARVASLRFFKDNVYTTRIKKEKKFKIKFQVVLKFAGNLPDYSFIIGPSLLLLLLLYNFFRYRNTYEFKKM